MVEEVDGFFYEKEEKLPSVSSCVTMACEPSLDELAGRLALGRSDDDGVPTDDVTIGTSRPLFETIR